MRLDLETGEEWNFVRVELDLLLVRGHDLANERQRLGVNLGAIDQYLADILAQVVAHGANDDVGFTVNQKRCRAFACFRRDGLPHLNEVIQVPL